MLAFLFVLLGAGEATACSCSESRLDELAEAAATVVEAEVARAGSRREGLEWADGAQLLRLRVDAVYKPREGVEAGRTIAVRYVHCNTATVRPREAASIWFLGEVDGELTGHRCDGSAPATPEGREDTRMAVARATEHVEAVATLRAAAVYREEQRVAGLREQAAILDAIEASAPGAHARVEEALTHLPPERDAPAVARLLEGVCDAIVGTPGACTELAPLLASVWTDASACAAPVTPRVPAP